MRKCHACRKELAGELKVGRKDECPFCGADVRCCLNCRFFDRAAPKQCRETITELVREKGKANFCDFFAFSADGPETGEASVREQAARRSLEDLFKK